ncbi:MAG: hypothetical protein ACR2F6_18670 [Mycobacteriales bacterium]
MSSPIDHQLPEPARINIAAAAIRARMGRHLGPANVRRQPLGA